MARRLRRGYLDHTVRRRHLWGRVRGRLQLRRSLAVLHPNTYLVIAPWPAGFENEGSATVEVVVHNQSGATVRLWPTMGGGDEVELAHQQTRHLTYGAGAEAGPLLVSFLDGWAPGAPQHSEGPRVGTALWPSRATFTCSPPTRSDDDLPFVPRYDKPWALSCELTRAGSTEVSEISIPRFLRSWVPPTSTWHDFAAPIADWFAAGLYRERMNGEGPADFKGWPWFEANAGEGGATIHGSSTLRRIAPVRYRVTASSTLSGAGGRYRAGNLGDGRPDTAWCEGAEGFGHGAELTINFTEPTKVAAVGLLPGMVRADWVYEANAVPTAARIIINPAGPDHGREGDKATAAYD